MLIYLFVIRNYKSDVIIVRSQPHFATENLELVRDEDGNNLLHISAAHGHADCLQHLTSLMGEDCLNERNNQQLTPAGFGVKVSSVVYVLFQYSLL